VGEGVGSGFDQVGVLVRMYLLTGTLCPTEDCFERNDKFSENDEH
jgi:hypothetical protein